MAQAYVAEGDTDRAIEEFKLTLMFDPDSPLVYARLAAEYIKKGLLAEAMEVCKQALDRDPKYIDARLILAGLYSAMRETHSAVAEYDRVLKQDPKHEEAVVYKAQVLLEAGRPAEALAGLRQFVNSSESANAWYQLGKVELAEDHTKDAVRAFRKALEIRPGFIQAALSLGYLYEEKGSPKEAIAVYREAFEESQDSAAANRIATIYLKLEQYDKAVPYLEAAIANDPEDLNARIKLGLVNMQLKKYAQAETVFKGVLEKAPESDRVHYYLGSLYEEMRRFDDAIEQLRQIPPSSKLYADSAVHVAFLLKQADRIKESRKFIAEAIKQSPGVANFYVFQASLEEDAKNIPRAISILEPAADLFPTDERLRYYLGSLYDRQGDTDKSLDQMEAILKINSDNVDALNYVGYMWTTQGVRLADAERVLQRAMKLRPNNGYITDSWGWFLYVSGRISEAVVALEKASQLKPKESTILEHLADAYLRSNLREKALAKYQEAAEYAETDAAREKILAKAENLKSETNWARTTQPRKKLPAGTVATPTGSASSIPDRLPAQE